MVDALSPGTVVGGDFVVVRPLDEGGMGAIYIVEQKSTGKTRALKVMHREIAAHPDLQRRFEQEARIGARIKSDHVVDVVAAGVDDALHLPYLVMELLDGEDLRHRIDARGALPHEEVKSLFEQMCHALAAAHAAGIVHRDIKPENVFVARAQRAGGDAFTVKVLDFGIAKVTAEAGTKATRGTVGSPLWMAPEQTQPVSNESNVADAVVKKAIEWDSWQYLRCYERYFGGAKDLVEGTVVVSYEIIDQLPRHAKAESSTFASAGMTDCVRSTLLGETINAAGPDGKGKATHAFKFVPVD